MVNFVALHVYFSNWEKPNSVKERKIGVFCRRKFKCVHKKWVQFARGQSDQITRSWVGNCPDNSIVMAEKENKKRGNYCTAGCPNMSNCANNSSTPGISMHYFPAKDETLRQKWIRFVRIHRKDFVPSKSATLCSVHFEETCFETKPWIITSSETGESLQPKRCLKRAPYQRRTRLFL